MIYTHTHCICVWMFVSIRDSNPYQIRRIYFIFVFSIQLKSWVLSLVKWNINNIWKYHSSYHLSFLSLFHFFLSFDQLYSFFMYVQMCSFIPVVKICFWQKYWPQAFDISLSGSEGLWFGWYGFMSGLSVSGLSGGTLQRSKMGKSLMSEEKEKSREDTDGNRKFERQIGLRPATLME